MLNTWLRKSCGAFRANDARLRRRRCLVATSSVLTTTGNECGDEQVFSRQLEGLAQAGDMAIGITTSGNSANVVRAHGIEPCDGPAHDCHDRSARRSNTGGGRRVPVRSIGRHRRASTKGTS